MDGREKEKADNRQKRMGTEETPPGLNAPLDGKSQAADSCKEQNQVPLIEAIETFCGQDPAYFRIPAHRFARGISRRFCDVAGEAVYRCDLSEAEGLDDLHHAEGAIRDAQRLAAKLWGAEETFFLVNGTTCGNEAMVLGTAGPGEHVLVPRNAHKSILMGLIMSGAVPHYVAPQYSEAWGLWGSVSPDSVEQALRGAKDMGTEGCRSVFLVSPTYYGVCSDLTAVSRICRRYGALLCVDEAHGSHLYFSDRLPQGALAQGADLCAQSIHKTAGSMTQSSMLQVGTGRADRARIAAALQMVQSTSPSYVLMASLDGARRELALHGREMMERAAALAGEARDAIGRIPGMRVLTEAEQGQPSIFQIDPTRLVFSARELGLGGYRLQELLYERAGVSTELADEQNVVCVITYANTQGEIGRLVRALEEIAGERRPGGTHRAQRQPEPFSAPEPPQMILTPREAYFHKKTEVPWSCAAGKIAGEMLVPYPPGIPLVYPGEVLTRELWEQAEACRRRGQAIHGPASPTLEKFQVIE